MRHLALFLACTLATPVFAGSWQVKTSVDAMTDEKTTRAYVVSEAGHRFTVITRNYIDVWGYVKLNGKPQFAPGQPVKIRIDKNNPVKYSDELDTLNEKLGEPSHTWEWNPSLVGFRIWYEQKDAVCGTVNELATGENLVVRYYPNNSTHRDISFSLNGSRDALARATGFDFSECTGQ